MCLQEAVSMQSAEQERCQESQEVDSMFQQGQICHVALCSTDCQIHRKLNLSYLQAVEIWFVCLFSIKNWTYYFCFEAAGVSITVMTASSLRCVDKGWLIKPFATPHIHVKSCQHVDVHSAPAWRKYTMRPKVYGHLMLFLCTVVLGLFCHGFGSDPWGAFTPVFLFIFTQLIQITRFICRFF